MSSPLTYYEFFAGGGMARAGLGTRWKCLFANDFDQKKVAAYSQNWGSSQIVQADVRALKTSQMPDHPGLVWASFPCQDLSLAGGGAGLKGDRSGSFWPFWSHMRRLIAEGRAPAAIALENVVGTLTSHEGQDFSALCAALHKEGYRYGAMIVDAVRFVPQSRPRLFIIATRGDIEVGEFAGSEPSSDWHPQNLVRAYGRLPRRLQDGWVWWNMPSPSRRRGKFADLLEEDPTCVRWHTEAQTKALLSMMTKINREKVARAQESGERMVGTIYKRTRVEDGQKSQRAEIRFDDVAGCLRTPAGGSSRQLIMVVEGPRIRSRLISSRETARLMGLPDSYILPENYNEAYHLTGDGVAVPVVRHIARNLLRPIVERAEAKKQFELAI